MNFNHRNIVTGLVLCVLMLVACKGNEDKKVEKQATVDPVEQQIIELNKAIEKDPKNAQLLAQRGNVYYENKIYDKAIQDLTASIRQDSAQAPVWHLLADAQIDGLRSREALNTMIFAASTFKERMPTLLKLAEFQLILQKYDDALATLDRAAILDKNEGEVFFMIGAVLQEKGDTIRAMNSYQRATELNPDIIDAWVMLARLHEARGNKIAERYYKTAISVDRKDANSYRMLADYYARSGRLDEALKSYDEAILRNPRMSDAFYNSGLVYMGMDSINKGKAQFDRAIEVSPFNVKAYIQRGMAFELLGNKQKALNDYTQALNMSPRNEDAKAALEKLQKQQ